MKINVIQSFLFVAFISGFSFGQSFMNINDGKINISANTAVDGLNVFIGEGCQVINRGELTVWGLLGNSAGTSGLVMKADAGGYGSLLHYTNGVQATVEQYLESERWHMVSAPVTGTAIEPYLNIYLAEWQEPNSLWTYLVTPVSLPMEVTRGYACWADDMYTGNTTVSLEGQLIASNKYMTGLTHTPESSQPGWNLAGNPYPCALEWNASWILNNMSGWAILYDNGTYKGWNPWMPEGEESYNGKANGYIAPTQGFWVRAIGPDPLVMIPQSARAHKESMFLKEAVESTVQNLHLRASANGYEDETTLLFLADGTNGFDGLYELEKHFNVIEAPTLYSTPEEGLPMAIQVLPEDWIDESEDPVIPVGLGLLEGTTCTITAHGLESFSPGQTVYLEDLQEDVMHDLQSGPYAFTSISSDQERFLLHFGIAGAGETDPENEVSIYSYGEYVYIQLPAPQSGTARVHDLMGKLICEFTLTDQLTKKALPETGYYLVSAIAGNSMVTEKVFIAN